jgi:hypothetical protein
VIRCFWVESASEDDFLDSVYGLAKVRARALRGTVVDAERLLSVDGAYCASFEIQWRHQIKPFQTVPGMITEVHLHHANQLYMMQLESDPQHHESYRQAVGTVLGSLRWK